MDNDMALLLLVLRMIALQHGWERTVRDAHEMLTELLEVEEAKQQLKQRKRDVLRSVSQTDQVPVCKTGERGSTPRRSSNVHKLGKPPGRRQS